MSKGDLSLRELIPSAILGIGVSIVISIILLQLQLSGLGMIINGIIIAISAILSGVIVIKYNKRSRKASITGTHTLSFLIITAIQYWFSETMKDFLGITA